MDLKPDAKVVIESLTCSIHHQHPSLVMKENQLELQTCCRDFKNICMEKLMSLMMKAETRTLHIVWHKNDAE